MFAVTCALIAAGVIAFALRERQGDPQAARFHALLTLVGGAMLCFLCADTLLIVYAAWEAMGIISYLLIAWPGTGAARRAARQAFWTTRLTDFGLLFAVLILLSMFHWPTLSSINVTEYMQGLAQQSSDPLAQLRVGFAWIGAAALLVTLA
jgi:NADH:ubiquinone oxidoreductase subunit 5 (subunit L)/multisubunit Na+/H+ antiporter MnhA subunit